MKRFVMLAALLAAACQPIPVEGGKADLAQAAPVAAVQSPADEASACAARGGKMLPQGRMQTLQCVVSYSDGGQRCTDGDQCQGSCRVAEVVHGPPRAGAAAVGQCQPTSSSFGCYTTVEDGKAEATICVD